VRSDSTVAQLHQALQVAFGWEDEHLNRFEIRGREYAVYRDGGGVIGIDARSVRGALRFSSSAVSYRSIVKGERKRQYRQ
jgi:hypothetical protein